MNDPRSPTPASSKAGLTAWGRGDEQFRLVVESSPAAMIIVDQAGRIVMVNAQAERWFGYARVELLGQPVEIVVPERFRDRHPADRDRYMADPQVRPMGGRGIELSARRRDGSEFPVDISLHPIRTEDGVFVLANVIDITERKRAEEEERRRQAMERLAVLGQLAGGVAHEIRNPLGVIKNSVYYLQMLQNRLDSEVRECLDDIDRELHTAERIVSELLDYARDPRQHAVRFVAQDVIDRAIHKSEIPANVQLDREPAAAEAIVLADHDQIERALLNLIRNAVQAMPGGGRLAVRSAVVDGRLMIEVADTGVGLTAEEAARVFEPLYTKKAKGIGLGLAVSRRYAERNGGALELESTPGQGATFRLRLPLADGQANKRDAQ
ncbi:MAG TPA: PAS domain S-box protein [Planctomycetaceae bacterium]|nr:PAS domain S-box protein [Planctomycetaceae bacterium]